MQNQYKNTNQNPNKVNCGIRQTVSKMYMLMQ